MVRPTNQEMAVIGKKLYPLSQEKGTCYTTGGHPGKHQGHMGAEGEGEMWAGDFIVVFTGRNGQGGIGRLRNG